MNLIPINKFKKEKPPVEPEKKELIKPDDFDCTYILKDLDVRLTKVELKLSELMNHLLEETYKGSGRKKLTKVGQSLKKSLLKQSF